MGSVLSFVENFGMVDFQFYLKTDFRNLQALLEQEFCSLHRAKS